jgi:UDP-N-acetylmuramate dehydrogenase
VWDRHLGRLKTFFASDCGFTYRDSRFKHGDGRAGRYLVLDVLFQLRVVATVTLQTAPPLGV